MPKKKSPLVRYAELTWNDLEEWAGGKILARGKNYQRQGQVSDLTVTKEGGLLAWVNGTKQYATRVIIGTGGLPSSACTCPYQLNCKHGVAVVIEYLEQVEQGRPVPAAKPDDLRLILLENGMGDEGDDDEHAASRNNEQEIDNYLKGLTKARLIGLIHKLTEEFPEIGESLLDRRRLSGGDAKLLVKRLRKEIREVGSEPGWQDHWHGRGYCPDYSGIRRKLESLLETGKADEVLTLGRELLATGASQVGQSHDEGETAMAVAACMPVIVLALDRSSLDDAEKLGWAVGAVLEDEYELCEDFAEYLHRQHPKNAWNTLSDQLLWRLGDMKPAKSIKDFHYKYERDQISRWAIHALERAGRTDEIIPLCITEAKQTGSYVELVDRLIKARRLTDAEKWIGEGIRATKDVWPGIAANLREKMRKIRSSQKKWPAVAAMRVEEFVRYPSRASFSACMKVCAKVNVWSEVRESLLCYLEKGMLPWERKGWPLPVSGLERPAARRDRFPMVEDLIDIAIIEKKPDEVLMWYDQRPRKQIGQFADFEDAVATAVKVHAPDRSVAIWKELAERRIAQVKPSAYQEAAVYLRKAGAVMTRGKKSAEWKSYLEVLREKNVRKRRLIEILDGLAGKPIVRRKR